MDQKPVKQGNTTSTGFYPTETYTHTCRAQVRIPVTLRSSPFNGDKHWNYTLTPILFILGAFMEQMVLLLLHNLNEQKY